MIKLTQFWGLNKQVSSTDLKESISSDLQNIQLREGMWSKRHGLATLVLATGYTGRVLSMFGKVATINNHLLVSTDNGDIIREDSTALTWDESG